ncbi:MAG TPA: hypothetical protein VE617_11295 [Propionibacteriaceae bacterium]|nr:hypothetical protein [Propionibacteriaceae bacterium]
MSEVVRCEQVVLGWSANSLLGSDGFGPVFASTGWRLPVGDRDAGLGGRARFLDQGAAVLVDDGAVPPRCLAYERTDQGSLLISKAYATGASRPGQYVVHALLDPTGRLGPRDLFACADRGLLRTEQPGGEADAGWPAVEVQPVGPAEAPGLDHTAEAVLSALLRCLADRRPMILASRDPERAEQVVRQVVAVLPDALAGGLSLATFASDPAGEGVRLAVAVPPFSRPGPVDLDLDAGAPQPAGPSAEVVAALTGPGPKPGLDRVTSVSELFGWAQLESGRLDRLGAEEVRRLLTGPLWRRFLERVDETGSTRLLLDGLLDPEVRPALAARLAEPDAELAGLLARAVARPSGLSPNSQGVLQDQVVGLLGPTRFARSVLPLVHKLAKKGGPVAVAATPLADLVAASTGRRGSAPLSAFSWYVDTSTWSLVTEQRLTDWVNGAGPPSAALVAAVAREPAGFATTIDQIVAEQLLPTRALLARMRDWPDAELEALLVGLLRTRRTARLFVLDVLGARSPEVARPLLRRYWSEVTQQAELSPTLAGLLEVADDPKRSRWPWGRP